MNKEDVDFEVQAALAWHDEDVNATIATLLEDIRHLRQQLALAEGVMSLDDQMVLLRVEGRFREHHPHKIRPRRGAIAGNRSAPRL